jgi:RNA recognition motif-containing protein
MTTLFVGNLSRSVSEQTLDELFSLYGPSNARCQKRIKRRESQLCLCGDGQQPRGGCGYSRTEWCAGRWSRNSSRHSIPCWRAQEGEGGEWKLDSRAAKPTPLRGGGIRRAQRSKLN